MKTTQTAKVLALLRLYGATGLTPQDAIREIGCYRLAARILDLKTEGIHIESRLATDSHGHRYARYYLVEQPVQMVVGF